MRKVIFLTKYTKLNCVLLEKEQPQAKAHFPDKFIFYISKNQTRYSMQLKLLDEKFQKQHDSKFFIDENVPEHFQIE